MTGALSGDGVRARLAEVLRASHGRLRTVDEIAGALLLTVEAIAAEAAAQAFETAAVWLEQVAPDTTSDGISWDGDVADPDTAMAWCTSALRDHATELPRHQPSRDKPMTPAFTPAEASRLASIDAAPDAPESYTATIERMAQAMWDGDAAKYSEDGPWDGLNTAMKHAYRRAATVAYRAEHEGGAGVSRGDEQHVCEPIYCHTCEARYLADTAAELPTTGGEADEFDPVHYESSLEPREGLLHAAKEWIWRHTKQPNGDRWLTPRGELVLGHDPNSLNWAAENLLCDLEPWLVKDNQPEPYSAEAADELVRDLAHDLGITPAPSAGQNTERLRDEVAQVVYDRDAFAGDLHWSRTHPQERDRCLGIADRLLAGPLRQLIAERNQARELATWLVTLDDDDPESPGRQERRTVTLTQIINRARRALDGDTQ